MDNAQDYIDIERHLYGGKELTIPDLEHQFKCFGLRLLYELNERNKFELAKSMKDERGNTEIYETPVIQFYMRKIVSKDKDGNKIGNEFHISTNIKNKFIKGDEE